MTTQRNDDSAMISLRELMKMEDQRVESERLARAQAEAERTRRAAEERARAEAELVERTRAAEQARLDEERTRREIEARQENERAERELRIRLEVEQQRRAAEHTAMLAHHERLAQLAPAPRRTLSGSAAFGLVALTLGGIFGVGAFLHTQTNAARSAPTLAAPAPVAVSSAEHEREMADLRRQRDEAIARANAARAATNPIVAAPNTPNTNHPRGGHQGHGGTHPTTTTRPQDNGINSLDLDGDSMITGHGIEGGSRTQTRRPNRR